MRRRVRGPKRNGSLDDPRFEFRRVRHFARIVFAQSFVKVISQANIKMIGVRHAFQNVHVVKAHASGS